MILVATQGDDYYMGESIEAIQEHIKSQTGEYDPDELIELDPFTTYMENDNGEKIMIAQAMIEQIIKRPHLIPICIASENC